ncbi:protein boule-like [Salminus brasiliensis]|uniref:protein boule-like n=1 Tax=Salminus brasiliensis TaxID=930266 RepID=UPI003B8334D1
MESEAGTQTSSPSTSPVPVELTNTLHQAPRLGTVIPNRIFVGGIDVKTNESDLRRFFSQYGMIKEVKIVIDRAGVSKGYGFVTFETQEDAQKILHDADRLCFRDKRLNIGQAIRKQQVGAHSGSYTVPSPGPSVAHQAPLGTMYLTTPTGYPYTYHNGVAYFHTPEPNTHTSHWHAPHTMSGSPVIVTHSASSFCTPQPYHQCQASSQYLSGHIPWTIPHVESPVPVSPSPLLYVQPAELMYQPMEIPAENGCVQSAMPLMEATIPEAYVDHMVQPQYPICMQGPIILSQDGVKHEQKFHSARRSFSHSPVHMKPRYCRGPHYTYLRKNYRPDLSQVSPPPASSPAQEMLK